MNDEAVIWQPNEGPQTEFLQSPARECLFGGSAGSGKTMGLLMAALSQTPNPLHRALVLRRSFPQLRDLIETSHVVFAPLGATYLRAERQWRFPNGAIVEFGFLDVDSDKYNFQGRAFSFLGFDELTQWPGDSVDAAGEPVNGAYVYLMSRLRTREGSGLRHEVRATTNPGGIGNCWVKSRFGIPDDGGASERRDPVTGYRRVFIPARLKDNPYLNHTDYARTLDALSDADRKTLKEGRWDVYEGAVFSEWNPRLHVCDSFQVPSEWEMWRGADDGYAAPACVLWFAQDKIHDRIYVVQELYRSGMTPEVMASAVLPIDGQLGRRGFMDGVIDSASFADVGMGGGRANVMNSLGCRWKPSEKGPGSRIAGKALIHARLALRADGHPGLVLFRTCRELIRTLPALPYSKTHPEDVSGSAEDHAYEALRVGLSRKVIKVRLVPLVGI